MALTFGRGGDSDLELELWGSVTLTLVKGDNDLDRVWEGAIHGGGGGDPKSAADHLLPQSTTFLTTLR